MSTTPLGGPTGPGRQSTRRATPTEPLHVNIDAHVIMKGDEARVEFGRTEITGGLGHTSEQLQGLSQKVRNQVMKQIVEQAGAEIARQLTTVLVRELVAQKLPPEAAQAIAAKASQEALKAVTTELMAQLAPGK